jgi:hypothetical protein
VEFSLTRVSRQYRIPDGFKPRVHTVSSILLNVQHDMVATRGTPNSLFNPPQRSQTAQNAKRWAGQLCQPALFIRIIQRAAEERRSRATSVAASNAVVISMPMTANRPAAPEESGAPETAGIPAEWL